MLFDKIYYKTRIIYAHGETKQNMKKIVNIFSTVLLVIVISLAGMLVVPKVFGADPYTVLSGSMEPTYHVGSVIYVVDVDPNKLKVGDPLTYVIGGGTVVTHRIVDIVSDEDNPTQIRFQTKGDNNNTEDGALVRPENIIGKPIFSIPLLGYIAHYIQTPPFSYLAIGGCAVILLLTFIPDLLDSLFEEDKKKEEDEAESQ